MKKLQNFIIKSAMPNLLLFSLAILLILFIWKAFGGFLLNEPIYGAIWTTVLSMHLAKLSLIKVLLEYSGLLLLSVCKVQWFDL